MDLFNFAEKVRDNIMAGWTSDEIEPEIIKVTKNNDVELTGIVFKKKNNNVCPTVYLELYYEMYNQGTDFEDILYAIRDTYEKSEYEADCLGKSFVHLEKNLDSVIFRLVNYEKNKKMLNDAPYIPFHDLAITFRWILKKDDKGMASALVTNADMEKWNISVSKLYEAACKNTRICFPYTIESILEKLAHMKDEDVDLDEIGHYENKGNVLYVLSNDDFLNGASAMLYPGVMESCAEIAGGSIYIIPSSVHEIIFINESEANPDELKLTLNEVNSSIVSETDILSDNIYYYDRESKKISIA